MERIGSIWTMIVRYLLLVMFGGVIVWACNSAGISVYADDGETPDGAELIRFDFHKSVNQEVGIPAGIPGFFTYFYEGKEYHYGFRFDRNGTGPETEKFGTAYVWAPYTVIYYDAAGGEIENYGTATAGGRRLFATRGNGEELEAGQNKGKNKRKFAADYTVYGQSLRLSEGCMPTAVKDGYRFEGWYAWTDAGVVQEKELAELAKQEQYGTLEDELNEKYTEQTKLLEKAGNLSGGQCQRLVIARALLKDAEVYIFDEATSNIDIESEELIMQVIHELAKTRTVLLISHRLANVVKSDQIYFLKDGEIKERGTHAELMEENGAYRHLYESQMALEHYGEEGSL